MPSTPGITDVLDPNFVNQILIQSDAENYDDEGNAIGNIPEASTLHERKPTAEKMNVVCAALRSTSTALTASVAFDDAAALSVLGRASNTTGARADIAASTDDTFLGRTSGSLSFSAITANQVGAQTLYSVDFSTLATNTLSDGTEVIDGFSWTIANAAAATTFAVENTTGIHFDATTTSTVYSTSSRTATNMSIAISTLIPSWDPLREYVIEIYCSSLTLGTSANRVLVCLDNTVVGGANRLLGGGRQNASGTQQTYTQRNADALVGAAVTDDCFAIRISGNGVVVCSGDSSGSNFPSVYNFAAAHTASDTGVSVLHPSSALVIAFVTGEAGGAMDVVLRRLRVRRLH